MAAAATSMPTTGTAADGRVDWVDYSKGICIVMVVMMHSTLGMELAVGREGFMHNVVEFARPFRMPDFFMISGLFLARVIDRDWRTYLDRKVVHFAYFYVLWVTIQFVIKAPAFAAHEGWAKVGTDYLEAFIEPFGTLWFIYLLPIFFVVTKFLRGVHPLIVWLVLAGLEMTHLNTGWTVPDEFCARFVYFFTGYWMASRVFALAAAVQAEPRLALMTLVVWAFGNAALVHLGVSTLPGVSLAMGLAGACAVIAVGALLARMNWLNVLRYCGEHSIVIYLAFFLPMAATRTALLRFGLIADVGWASVVITAAGVIGALCLWWSVRSTQLKFLFERPAPFWLTDKPRPARLQAAE
jgi:uncharacterized membrane protein YcfT